MSKLTEYIDLELKRRKIKKQDLLDYVGVSRVAYSRWAKGEAHPKFKSLLLRHFKNPEISTVSGFFLIFQRFPRWK